MGQDYYVVTFFEWVGGSSQDYYVVTFFEWVWVKTVMW